MGWEYRIFVFMMAFPSCKNQSHGMNFIDNAIIEVSSGKGGKGHMSFRKEKFVPLGGPDGGNGGKGGDIVFEADRQLTTLLDFRYERKYQAEDGKQGGTSRCTGKSGKDKIIRVPSGTVIRNVETQEVIADLTEDKQRVTIAKGGRGGRGNAEFTTSVNQAPRHFEPGEPGEEFTLELELKILADIGLVGFPNAGKSTLISVMSAAKPKIADYPFTTLIPNLGMVYVGNERSFTMADIPGLIEGAHEGKGLGIQFLRHVERTKVLVFLLDAMSGDPVEEYSVLCEELRKYDPSMLEKPRIICISKMDTVTDADRPILEALNFGKEYLKLLISAVSGENIEVLKREMWKLLSEAEKE